MVIQRVKQAQVSVDGQVISQIPAGLVVLLAVAVDDDAAQAQKMAKKILNLRLFDDRANKINLSVQAVRGAILVVSQFTLYGDCCQGHRPSFIKAANGETARPLYEAVISLLRQSGLTVATGQFGSAMELSLVNDGPTTVMLEL